MAKFCLYPFFAAAFIVLALFANNLGEVEITQFILPLLAVLVLAGLVFAVSTLVLGSRPKGALTTAFLVLMFFFYGHFRNIVKIFADELAIDVVHHRYLLPAWGALIVIGLFCILTTRRPVGTWTRSLNYFWLIMLFVPSMKISSFFMKDQLSFAQGKVSATDNLSKTTLSKDQNAPDIYYLIFDRYANQAVLQEIYDFDNSPFLNFLRRKGFYVVDNGAANYFSSAHSLASSLNMEHVTYLSDEMGRASRNKLPLFKKIKHFRVQEMLKSNGYKFIHLGSWWQPTYRNMHADENIDIQALSEFAMVLYQTTMLYPIDEEYLHMWAVRSVHCRRVPYKFTKLRELSKADLAQFVFAHFLIPHPPYVFDRNGKCVTKHSKDGKRIQSNYIEQMRYVNRELESFIETVLNDTMRPAIIILQSDEGPVPETVAKGRGGINWRDASLKELRQKAGILNAYYFPRRDYEKLYDTITPVNSFRVVFNEYFGTDFELLPDEIYAHVDDNRLYDLMRVTEQVRGRQ